MDEEVEACSRIYTAKLNELEAKSGIRASHRSVVLAKVLSHQVPWIRRKKTR